jgi:hypothetical protein
MLPSHMKTLSHKMLFEENFDENNLTQHVERYI